MFQFFLPSAKHVESNVFAPKMRHRPPLNGRGADFNFRMGEVVKHETQNTRFKVACANSITTI